MRRVVITGMGALSPLGLDAASLQQGLAEGASGVKAVPAWEQVRGLSVRVAAFVPPFDEKQIPRPARRTMGKLSILAGLACQQAVEQAGLTTAELQTERVGLFFGSTTGSPAVIEEFFNRYAAQGMEQTPGTEFMKVMSHTTAVNAALLLGIRGRVESLSAACATSSQSIGSGFDAVRCGLLDVVVTGGAEELHPTTAGTFDVVAAASRCPDPECAPRPFDQSRDGLVLGEGAGALVLEERERALARGAKIFGEIAGYATTCSADHMTAPSAAAMEVCMRQALASARLEPSALAAINAHATGTLQGDAAEALATANLRADSAAMTAFKSNLGHTLAASAALEAIGILGMMRAQEVWPILRLRQPLAEGRTLHWIRQRRTWNPGPVLKNSFAFGGINASLIFLPSEAAPCA